MDSDRSGRISIDEFERGMRKIGAPYFRGEYCSYKLSNGLAYVFCKQVLR